MSFPDTRCLYTTLKNGSGTRKHFGFLPPHGRWLDADEEITIFGHIQEAVINDVQRVTSRQNLRSLETALQNGDLEIVQTPNPIMLDATTGDSKMLVLDDEELAVADPCWVTNTLDSDIEPY